VRQATLGILAALAILTSAARAVHAQEFEPRTYAVAPVGVNFIGIGYGFATGNVFMDPSLPVKNVDGDIHLVVTRYTRSLSLFRRPSKVKVILPWSSGDWDGTVEGEFERRKATGPGDARIIVEILFHGAEVMTSQEMKNYEPRTVFGARLGVSAPTGDYDNTKAINLGTNRLSFAGELGLATPLGRWSLEAMVGARFFTTNDDYVNGLQLEQDPLLVAKLHAVRTIRPGFWWALAAGYGYGYGARTTVDGVTTSMVSKSGGQSVRRQRAPSLQMMMLGPSRFPLQQPLRSPTTSVSSPVIRPERLELSGKIIVNRLPSWMISTRPSVADQKPDSGPPSDVSETAAVVGAGATMIGDSAEEDVDDPPSGVANHG
jgi:hypothetical protein